MSARDDLLAAALQYVTEHGVGEISLRALAAELGTSHRMLIYHFGSREGLLVEVVRAVERRQRERLAEIMADPDLTPIEQERRFWEDLIDPAQWPAERLFFELYGQALRGRKHAVPLLDGIVTDWLDPLTEIGVRQGLPREEARARVRLGLAVARGLLLDLLATEDIDGIRAAYEVFLADRG